MTDTLAQLQTGAQQLAAVAGSRGVAVALENAELLALLSQDLIRLRGQTDRLNQRLREFEELARTLALLNSSLDLKVVLQEVIDTIIRLADAERAYLMLYERD